MKRIIIGVISLCFSLSVYGAEKEKKEKSMRIDFKKKHSANPEVPPTPKPHRVTTSSNPQTPKVETPKAQKTATPKNSPKSSGKSSPLTGSTEESLQTPKTSVKSMEDLRNRVNK